MNKYERVKAAIAGREVDHVPSCFSLHFPREQAFGEAAVKAHLDFYRGTDTDILKVMNENLVPSIGKMDSPSDWSKLPAYDGSAPFIQAQAALIRRIREEEPDAYILATVHGALASTLHPLEENYSYEYIREMLPRQLKEDPEPQLEARNKVSDAMIALIEACVEAGCDGIYYAALGGERRYFTDEQFEYAVKPYDLKILKAAKETGTDVFLHICKDKLNMERYRGYDEYADVINWGVYEAPYGIDEGKKLFPGKTIMGGLANRTGVMADGTIDDISRAAKDVIAKAGKRGFILGADCTLATEIDITRVRAAVSAATEA